MICPKCSRPTPDGAPFCANCGQAVNTAAASGAAGAGIGATGAALAARLPGLIERAKNMLLTPKTEWAVVEPEPTSIAALYTGYVIPLAALAAVMSFVRLSLIGFGNPFGAAFRTPILTGLVYALVSFGFGLLGLYLVGLIINGLAPTFGGERNQRQALKTAAYAFTPAWLSTVFSLLPAFASLLQLAAGLYGIYLLYLGLPLLMRSARDKAVGYTVTVVLCTLLMGIVLGALSAATGGFGGFGGYGRFGAWNGAAMTQEERQQQAAARVGDVLGNVLGTDQKGKADLGAAINNLAAAGQKMEQQQMEQQRNAAAEAAAPPAAAASAQSAVNATAGLLTALGAAAGGSRRADPVDFQTLKGLLPESLPGMQRTGAEGNSQTAIGVKGSAASADYQGPGGARARIKIADLTGVSGLLDLAGAMVQNTASESDTGYEKDATIGGRTMHEKYDRPSKHGELSVIVAKRFAVDVTGDGLDMSTLEQYAGSVDLARLDALKDAGAHPQ